MVRAMVALLVLEVALLVDELLEVVQWPRTERTGV
jgi:hypothetical protein